MASEFGLSSLCASSPNLNKTDGAKDEIDRRTNHAGREYVITGCPRPPTQSRTHEMCDVGRVFRYHPPTSGLWRPPTSPRLPPAVPMSPLDPIPRAHSFAAVLVASQLLRKPRARDTPTIMDTSKVLAATTPEDRAKEAAAFADSLKATDLAKFQGATVDALKAVLADKAKGNADKRAGVFAVLRAISVAFGQKAEAVLVPLLPDGLEGLADKLKPVCNEADKFIEALSTNLSTHAVKVSRAGLCCPCPCPARTHARPARPPLDDPAPPPSLLPPSFLPRPWQPCCGSPHATALCQRRRSCPTSFASTMASGRATSAVRSF